MSKKCKLIYNDRKQTHRCLGWGAAAIITEGHENMSGLTDICIIPIVIMVSPAYTYIKTSAQLFQVNYYYTSYLNTHAPFGKLKLSLICKRNRSQHFLLKNYPW